MIPRAPGTKYAVGRFRAPDQLLGFHLQLDSSRGIKKPFDAPCGKNVLFDCKPMRIPLLKLLESPFEASRISTSEFLPAVFLASTAHYAAERITHSWVGDDVQIMPSFGSSGRRGVIFHLWSDKAITAESELVSVTIPRTITLVEPPSVMFISSPAVIVFTGEPAMVSSNMSSVVPGPIDGKDVCADQRFMCAP
jgi:hypothetical protein